MVSNFKCELEFASPQLSARAKSRTLSKLVPHLLNQSLFHFPLSINHPPNKKSAD